MNFERGKDPKTSMSIGIKSISIDLQGIYERKVRYASSSESGVDYQIINGPVGHEIFGDIQKSGIQERHHKYWVKPKGSGQGYMGIDHMAGKWVEYLKSYYYIPENEF